MKKLQPKPKPQPRLSVTPGPDIVVPIAHDEPKTFT